MNIVESIRATIKYSQKYDGGLTVKQLSERLIGEKVFTKKEIKETLIQTPYLYKEINTFNTQKRLVEEKTIKAKDLAKMISTKNILLIGITGSVAAGYPKINDDIDIIVITKINKLWLTRFKLRLFMIINHIPHRKFGKKENKDEFCFNLWLDEKSLKLKQEKQNLKNAVDLILMKPLVNKEKTYEKFILTNDWIKKWVATGYREKTKKINFFENDSKRKDKIINIVINNLMFWPQYLYMRRKIENEKIGLHEAFFHH